MNKVITDGLVLMPPPFSDGLDVWSKEDGTPGSATYDGDPNAQLISNDTVLGSCMELTFTNSTQTLRYMGETPTLAGCYLRITARVKAVSGTLPTVRIAGWAGDSLNQHVSGLTEFGASIALTGYGEMVEVSAIVGTGTRTGVDMPWGASALYGHFGIDLIGGTLRIDDIEIEDVTSVFHRTMMDWLDVRDFGAIGDGVTDDLSAFAAADAAAAGRDILVPSGTCLLGGSITCENPVRFEGNVTMAEADKLILRGNFDLPAYIDAFGDEVTGFKKAFQALLNFTDHEGLDMKGRRIEIDGPIDLAAAVSTLDTFEVRRVIRNGQFNCVSSANWDTETFTSSASYSAANPKQLTAVADVANIPVGSLVEGTGVGREVYVTAKNVGTGTVDLSQPLWGAPGSQTYTFKRFKYVLDFSGFTKLSRLTFSDVDIQCGGFASGVMLAPAGELMHFRNCWFTKPKDRGISSIGTGCQDLQLDTCHFISNEQALPATDRVSIGLNVNANDAKIRGSRFQRMGTTMILHGNGHLIVGNHWFQGDEVTDGPRVAGLVLTEPNVKSVITGNYIDNCFVEWTHEHDAAPDFSNEYSFGGLSMTGNIFTCNDAASWFSWMAVKPFGPGHFLQGLSVSGNAFKSLNGSVARVETVDDSIAALDFSRTRNVVFSGNTFNGIDQNTINPVTLEFDQASPAASWVLDVSGYLPFGGWSREVGSVVTEGAILNAGGAEVFAFPYVTTNDGTNSNLVRLTWPEPVSGRVHVTARTDRPI